jgi:hypothetical protein
MKNQARQKNDIDSQIKSIILVQTGKGRGSLTTAQAYRFPTSFPDVSLARHPSPTLRSAEPKAGSSGGATGAKAGLSRETS